MQNILDAILAGDTSAEDFAALDLPESYRAVTVHKDEVNMFEGLTARDKDPRKSLHVEDVALPELGPGEAYVAVMASAINYNTVWSAIFEPVPTFAFLKKFGMQGWYGARHDLPYHILGSDGAGVIVRTGVGVKNWKVGDKVVISPAYVDEEDHASYDDGMMTESQLAWGFETVGRDGLTLSKRWDEGMMSLHGMHVHGFPNLFIVGFAQAANLISNVTQNLTEAGTTIACIVTHALADGVEVVETTDQAEQEWVALLETSEVA